jgi:hypothetical protein
MVDHLLLGLLSAHERTHTAINAYAGGGMSCAISPEHHEKRDGNTLTRPFVRHEDSRADYVGAPGPAV